jgi:hypothetical protein
MQTIPKVQIERFEQLSPGDLFIFSYNGKSHLALKAEDPERGRDKYILPLGPTLPTGMSVPTLLGWHAMTVISFGKDYIVRLPTNPSALRRRARKSTSVQTSAPIREITRCVSLGRPTAT